MHKLRRKKIKAFGVLRIYKFTVLLDLAHLAYRLSNMSNLYILSTPNKANKEKEGGNIV